MRQPPSVGSPSVVVEFVVLACSVVSFVVVVAAVVVETSVVECEDPAFVEHTSVVVVVVPQMPAVAAAFEPTLYKIKLQ